MPRRNDMRRRNGRLALALLCAPLAATATAQEEVATLKFAPQKKFDYVLPIETWTPANGVTIAHDGGQAFATESDGLRLHVDTNGDGRVDQKIQGAYGFAILTSTRHDGSDFGYAVRFRRSGDHYEYSTSGVMSGSLHGESIELIDLDNDGVFNEVGTDGMVVGGGKAACYLSEVVNLDGDLYTIEVDAAGTEIRAVPYDGPAGTLGVRRGLTIPGKLVSAVVSDATGKYSFEVGNTNDLRVPAGEYRLTGGFAESGGDSARLRGGSMAPLVVTDGGTAELEQWGAPLIAEFDYTRAGSTVTVQPSVRFVGRAGEEWYELLPDAKSPKLEFVDLDRNRVLTSARFEGC